MPHQLFIFFCLFSLLSTLIVRLLFFLFPCSSSYYSFSSPIIYSIFWSIMSKPIFIRTSRSPTICPILPIQLISILSQFCWQWNRISLIFLWILSFLALSLLPLTIINANGNFNCYYFGYFFLRFLFMIDYRSYFFCLSSDSANCFSINYFFFCFIFYRMLAADYLIVVVFGRRPENFIFYRKISSSLITYFPFLRSTSAEIITFKAS